MSSFDELLRCAGRWRGPSRLQDPGVIESQESESTLTVHPVLGGSFVRIDYTWAYRGKPQEGSLLVGHLPESSAHTAHWIDSWHMGRAVMACSGPAGEGAVLTLRGSYPAPPGPDWGWRIDLVPAPPDALRLVMYNVTPQGDEILAVDARYSPA